MIERRYIGDGLYASLDSWGRITLSTNRDDEGEHYVVLDADVFRELLRFEKEAKAAALKALGLEVPR